MARRERPARRWLAVGLGVAASISLVGYVIALARSEGSVWPSLMAVATVVTATGLAEALWPPAPRDELS